MSLAAGSTIGIIGGGQKCRIDGARLADRKRADRNAGRHLHDRQQAVLAGKRSRLDRDAEDRKRRHGRAHAGKMRSTACAGDDHLEPLVARALGEADQAVGRAMGGNDPGFVGDVERLERVCRVLHRLPVRLASHDDGDGRGRSVGHVSIHFRR